MYRHCYQFLAAAALCVFAHALPARAQQTPATPITSPQPPVPYLAPEMDVDADGHAHIARAIESFSDISLKGSELKPIAPLLGSREDHGSYIRELWQVRWRPNDPIDLYVILPKGVKNPPVVLYLYGWPTETDRFKNDGWCKRVTYGGAAAVGFVSALTGHRYQLRPFKQTFLTELPEALSSSTHDIIEILNYLDTRKDLDTTRIGVFGQGSGATIATLAAAADARIKALDLLDMWADWPVFFGKDNQMLWTLATGPQRQQFITPEFQQALVPLEPLHYLPHETSIPIRLQFQDDQGIPAVIAEAVQKAAPAQASFVRFRTSKGMYNQNAGGLLFAWIAEALHATPAPQLAATAGKATDNDSAAAHN